MRMLLIGFVIAAIGGVALWFGGVPYKDRSKIVDIGAIEATVEDDKTFGIPPLVGGAILVLGIGVMAYGATHKNS